MLKNLTGVKIYVFDDYEKMSAFAADVIISGVRENPGCALGLATGSTPVGMYKSIIAAYKAGKVDFSKVKTFNLDEYYPIKKSDSQSYDYFMRKNLFDHINAAPSNINFPNGEAPDAAVECEDYEKKIAEAGGVDIQVLGIGANGHIGFNEPDNSFAKYTRLVALTESTVDANSRFFENKADVPKRALSMGIGTIMRAKKILFLANGANKSGIVKKAFYGDITPAVPASVLQLHRDVTVVLDKEAAAEL